MSSRVDGFVAPRPARRVLWVRGPTRSPIEALRADKLAMQELGRIRRVTSCCTIEAYVSDCDRKPYEDPELYQYGVLPPCLNPARIRGPQIHAVDTEDAVSPKSLTKQQELRRRFPSDAWQPTKTRKSTPKVVVGPSSEEVRPWDSTKRKLHSPGLWRPPQRHLAY